MTNESYAFGDSDVAAERLRLLAELFEPELHAFVSAKASPEPALAVDLGCGPGHTTRLLTEVLRPRQVVGIDSSSRFVRLASASAGLNTRFVVHDVSRGSLPLDSADVMLARLLLTHLPDPVQAVLAWLPSLAPDGVLLIDETEAIEADEPLIQDYFSFVTHVVASRGAKHNMGSEVEGYAALPGVSLRSSELVEHPIPLHRAVEMFIMNFRTLRVDPSVHEDFDALDAMAQGLRRLRNATRSKRIVWHMRQVVLGRA